MIQSSHRWPMGDPACIHIAYLLSQDTRTALSERHLAAEQVVPTEIPDIVDAVFRFDREPTMSVPPLLREVLRTFTEEGPAHGELPKASKMAASDTELRQMLDAYRGKLP